VNQLAAWLFLLAFCLLAGGVFHFRDAWWQVACGFGASACGSAVLAYFIDRMPDSETDYS
jgi:hypothetical protein